MNKTYSLDGVQNILAFPFKGPGWQSKFLIGAALSFASYIIPLLPSIVLLGYAAKIMRGIISDNAELALPEWDDWGDLLSRGAKVFGAMLVFMLPVFLLVIGGYIIMVVPILLSDISRESSYGTVSSEIGLQMLGMFGGMFLFFFGFVLSLPVTFILPPAIAHVIAKNSFAAAFRIKEWWGILRANFWGFFTAIVVVSGVYIVTIMFVYIFYFTIILCFLMPLALSVIVPYMMFIAATTIAEAYRKGVENLAAKDD